MILAVLFVVAMGVRLAHVAAIHDTPLFDVLLGDAGAYDAWARRLAGGDWVGADVFYQAPLYPYFLGVLYAAAGHDLLLVRVVQAAIGSAAAVLLASAGTRLFSRRVGLIAGFGLALYAPAIFFDALLQKTVLDVFFVTVCIWIVSRLIDPPPRTGLWLALGASLGALSLTRENALVLVAVALGWAVSTADGRQTADGNRQTGGWREARFAPALALAAGLAIVLLPVLARNYAVTGGVYLTTSQFGPNLYIGNSPGADGTYRALRPGRGAPEFERRDATELAEAALRRALTPGEVSAYWRDRALQFITARPGDWLALMARKLALLWNADEMLDTESQETYEEESPLLRVLAPIGHFGVLVPLALIGLTAAWPDRRRLWPFVTLLAAYAASVMVFYVFARYRFPLVPFLLILAAAGVSALPRLARERLTSTRLALASAVVVVAVATNWPMLSETRMRAITETNLGTALHEAGRYEEAIARYEKAAALRPDYTPAYNNLGVTLRAQGRVDDAIAAYERGLAQDETYADLHYNLANALLAENRTDEAAAHFRRALDQAPASAAAHNNLGMALASQGQYERAAAEFRAALALEPASVQAHRNLGNVLSSLGRSAEAVGALERAVTLDPASAESLYDLGSLLLDLGRLPEATRRLEAALALQPQSVETLNNLGIALASQGRLREAAAYFERALAIRPDFADAARNLATARQALAQQNR